MRRTGAWIGCLMAALLTSSCGVGAGSRSECAGWAPILVARQDVLTDGTARSVLAHNTHGRERCGW